MFWLIDRNALGEPIRDGGQLNMLLNRHWRPLGDFCAEGAPRQCYENDGQQYVKG